MDDFGPLCVTTITTRRKPKPGRFGFLALANKGKADKHRKGKKRAAK